MKMDDSSVQKAWERPWSTEEMRAQCSNWNLAGDAGLLKHIQEFSQNLIQKTHTTEVALDSLLEDMRNTSVDVQNATNALLMLSNNQFVENRVYDDCDDDKEEVKFSEEKTSGDGENALIAKAAQAILLGMSIVDSKFECVEVPASDSEGEEEIGIVERDGRVKKSFALVLEPKNPYSVRPLPHLIGSKEFMEDDRVGLGGGDEDEDEDEDEENDAHLGHESVAQSAGRDSGSSLAGDMADDGGIFDEDEVEERRLPKTNEIQSWESSSSSGSDDLEVENNIMRKKPKSNGSFDGTVGIFGQDNADSDLFGKESSSGDEFIGAVPSIGESAYVPGGKLPLQKSFNDELAAKLGTAKKNKEPEVESKNKKVDVAPDSIPKAKLKTPSVSSDLFGPPKDDWKDEDDMDSIFAASDGIFSGGRYLFNDLDESVAAPNKSNPTRDQSANSVPPMLSDKPPALTKDLATRKGNLFGDDNDDEPDVFADILVKIKAPDQEQKSVTEDSSKKLPKVISNVAQKDSSGKIEASSDAWLFDDDDDPLWSSDSTKKKEGKPFQSKDSLKEDEKKAEPPPKLPAGARSFYGNGIDPFALGKKLTKELEDKRKVKVENKDDEDFEKEAKVPSNLSSRPVENESSKEQVDSVGSKSLFDDLDDGNDLFAPVVSKVVKPKETTSSGLFDDGTFMPKNSQSTASKRNEKPTKYKSSAKDPSPKISLFGDALSNEDVDDDIFSGTSSMGSQAKKSKEATKQVDVTPNAKSADPLFEGELGNTGQLFDDTLGNTIFSEKDTEDDLFSGFIKKDVIKPKTGEKTEGEVPYKKDIKVKKGNQRIESDKTESYEQTKVDSDSLFGSLDDELPSQNFTNDSTILGKSDSVPGDFLPSDDILVTPENKGDDGVYDIFGEPYKRPDISCPDEVPVPNALPATSGGSREPSETTWQKKEEKRIENLFDDFRSGDMLSNKKASKNDPKTVEIPSTQSVPSVKKSDAKDLFGEFDSDGDDQKFATPKGKNDVDPLSIGSMSQEDDDIFLSRKPKVSGKTFHPEDESSELFSESDNQNNEPTYVKDWSENDTKEIVLSPENGRIPNEKESIHQPPSVGPRKSPPKTLNLEKVIPSPKLGHKVVSASDELLSSTETEDDKIIRAWMKGHPPPLRDSKVENTMDEVAAEFGHLCEGQSKICGGNEPYFGDIPTGSLLRSHGKERARIQNRRRPPSRKTRKTAPTSSASAVQTVEDEAKSEQSYATPPSKDSIEEDRGSQETIEEWSTPEASLKSPPRAVPPRSNPLSPSTDEEQDFFDVLPVGHYPPPMDPPGPLSPFSDALESGILEASRHEDLWDKEDNALFEDAGDILTPQMDYERDLWSTDAANAPATSNHQGYIATKPPIDDFYSVKAPKSGGGPEASNASSLKETRRSKEDDLFSEDAVGSSKIAPKNSKGAASKAAPSGSVKKEKVRKAKQENSATKELKPDAGKMDELWGSGFSSGSTFKDDIFSEHVTQSADFEDLFQGQGDLFGSSAKTPSVSEKSNIRNVGNKKIGKSLSKLQPKVGAPSLFDDDDDDEAEDLFSPHASQPADSSKSSMPSKKTKSYKPVMGEQTSKSSLKKVTADNSLFEDPLMVLKRKD